MPTQPEIFYQFGLLQLWVLGLFGRDEVHRTMSSIARSSGLEHVFMPKAR
jgi:hypothetical protein